MHEELNLGHWTARASLSCETLEQEGLHPSFSLGNWGHKETMLMGDIHRKRGYCVGFNGGGGTNRKLSGLFLGKIPR